MLRRLELTLGMLIAGTEREGLDRPSAAVGRVPPVALVVHRDALTAQPTGTRRTWTRMQARPHTTASAAGARAFS
eukprot:6206901-Pleurochrysis_carterae.AAC.1